MSWAVLSRFLPVLQAVTVRKTWIQPRRQFKRKKPCGHSNKGSGSSVWRTSFYQSPMREEGGWHRLALAPRCQRLLGDCRVSDILERWIGTRALTIYQESGPFQYQEHHSGLAGGVRQTPVQGGSRDGLQTRNQGFLLSSPPGAKKTGDSNLVRDPSQLKNHLIVSYTKAPLSKLQFSYRPFWIIGGPTHLPITCDIHHWLCMLNFMATLVPRGRMHLRPIQRLVFETWCQETGSRCDQISVTQTILHQVARRASPVVLQQISYLFVMLWRLDNCAWQPQHHDRLSKISGALRIHKGALTNHWCSLATSCGISLFGDPASHGRGTHLGLQPPQETWFLYQANQHTNLLRGGGSASHHLWVPASPPIFGSACLMCDKNRGDSVYQWGRWDKIVQTDLSDNQAPVLWPEEQHTDAGASSRLSQYPGRRFVANGRNPWVFPFIHPLGPYDSGYTEDRG